MKKIKKLFSRLPKTFVKSFTNIVAVHTLTRNKHISYVFFGDFCKITKCIIGVQSCLNENKNLHISSDNFDGREIVREKKGYMEDFK